MSGWFYYVTADESWWVVVWVVGHGGGFEWIRDINNSQGGTRTCQGG